MKHVAYRSLLLAALCAVAIPSVQAQGALDRLKGLGGNSKTGSAVDAAADAYKGLTLSDAEIVKLGADAAAAYDAQNSIAAANDPYTQRLNKLVANYKTESGLKLNYKVYKSPQINAFALPDGSIRVYSGLMDLMSDDELRFVIGHEIGHVKHGHSKSRFKTAYLAQAGRKGVAATNDKAARLANSELGGLVESVIKAQHSQSNELESDEYGLTLLKRDKFAPQAAVTALQKLDDGKNKKAGLLASHPDPASRAKRIAAQIK